MRLCLCVYALVCVCMYTGDHAPGFYLKNTSLRLQSEVKLHPRNHPLLITCNSTYIMCASIHACVCVSVCACMHVSVHIMCSANIMCSAGPEVAGLDWYGPEADPVYWRRGRGGWWWQDSR